MYIKYYFALVIFGIAYLLGLVIHPFMYLQKRWGGGIFWLWANKSEAIELNNWYGVYEIYDGDYFKFHNLNWFQKYLLSYEWLAIRNSHFNLKQLLFPFGQFTLHKVIYFKGDASPTTWRNKTILGETHVIIIDDKGRKSFRKSKGVLLSNGKTKYTQYGAGETRYHFKRRTV